MSISTGQMVGKFDEKALSQTPTMQKEISAFDKIVLDSAKAKLFKGENLNASERGLVGKYGLSGFSSLQTSEVFDLFANDNPQNTSRFEKIKIIKNKEDKGKTLTEEEKDFVETTKLINSLKRGYASNLSSLTADINQNATKMETSKAMDLYNDAAYEDDEILRNYNKGKLYVNTGLTSYFEGNANTLNAITGLITGAKPEDAVTGDNSYAIANAALKEYYHRNGENVNSFIQDIAVNMAQNSIPMLMSMAGGIAGGETLARLLSSATMAPSVFGNAYKEGVQLGVKDQGKLLLYSSLVTASELSLEYLLGSVPNTAGGVLSGELLESVSKSVNNVLFKATIKTMGNGLSEFTEESIQGIISPLLQRYILGADVDTIIQNPIESLSESAYSGLVGFVTSILTGGYSNLKNSINESIIQQNGKIYNDIMQQLQLDIKDVASFFKETSQNKEITKVADKILKGDNSDLTVGEFITDVINDTKNSSNSFYATIGQKIFSIENGVETVLNTYKTAVEHGAIFSEEVGYLYNQTKENFANNNIDTVTVGEFAFKLQAKLPNAQIFGKLTEHITAEQNPQSQTNGESDVVFDSTSNTALSEAEQRLIDTPDSELTPEQRAVKQTILERQQKNITLNGDVDGERKVVDLSDDNDLSVLLGDLKGAKKYKKIRDYIFGLLGGRDIELSDGKNAIVDKSDALHIANKSGTEKTAQISKIKEIIENAYLYAEDNDVEHNKFNAFCYYRTTVKYGEEEFPIYINVGKGINDGKYHIYDITKKIRDTAHRVNDVERPKPNEGYALENGISNTRVPQKAPGVNTIISDSEQNNTQESANEEREAVDLGGVDTDKARHLNRAEQERIKEIGKRLDRKVVFEDFYSSDKFKGKKKIPDGYIDGKGDIHINFYAKRPIQFVFKHEITHYLKRTLASYQDFMNMVINSKAFENWLHNKGYASIDELKAEITDTYSEVEGFDEGKCYDEILADFCAGYLFGGEKAVSQKLIDAMEPKKKRKFVEVIKDIIDYFKKKFSNDDLKTEIATIENAFIKVYNEAVKAGNTNIGETFSFAGYAEDGKGMYKSNFPKGTPKSAKGEKILKYIQDVWSKKPIRLKIEENGNVRYIDARFDPTFDESGNVPTDASKLMGGNRHGTSAEQRVTLDLADDYYQIASESKYNYSKDETGKDNPAHKDVTKWHYFVNDIYFAEYGSENYEPYRVSINVKEKSDGEYVYSFSAEKQRESDTPRTLHAVVNEGDNSNANAELSNNKLTQPELIVKNNISEDGDFYSIPTETATELLERYDKGEITREELIEGISHKKPLNPVQIVNTTEEDANTTPPLKRKQGENNGDKTSNTYDSLLQSDIFDDKFKEEVKLDSFIEKYQSVTNKETLKKAAKELDEGGRQRVQQWWATDSEHASLIDTAMGFILMDRYQRIGDYESAVAVAERVRQIGSTSGQQVQLFSILGRLNPNTMSVYAQKELSKAYETMVKGKTKAWIKKNAERFKLTEADMEFIRRHTLQAAQLPDGRDKAIRLAEIATLLQDKLPAQKGQALKALQRISLLLNPKTNIRNIVGNAGMVPVFVATDFFGAGVDKALSKIFKTDVRTTGSFDIKSVKGFKKGVFETLDDFKRHINTRNQELNRFEIGQGKSFNENHSGKLAKQLNDCAKVLNALDRFTSFCLELGDRPFYEMWFVNSINNQMKLNKVSEATPEMIAIASAEALQRTWQDTNKMVDAVSKAKGALNALNIGGYGLGDVMIKFTKTPANLTKAIVDFSPAGLVKSIASDGKALYDAVQTGQFEAQHQKRFVDSFSKGIVGTLLYVAAAALAGQGLLSGAGDDDEDVSNFEKYIQGIPEYSIKICGNWYSYEWMQPVGAVGAIVSDYMQNKEKAPDNEWYQNIWLALKSGGAVIYNQSFMQSIQNLFTADNILEGALDSILDDPSAFVPQIFSQTASSMDKYRRTAYESDNAFKTALNNVKYKLPWERKELEKQVDVMGRDVPNSQYGIINAFFNPANTFTDTSNEITDEIYSLYKQSGDDTVIPRKAPYSITVKKNKVNFSAEGRMDFQRDLGKTSSDILEKIFDSDRYQDLTESEKVKAVSSVYDYAMAVAKSKLDYDYETLSAIVGERVNGEPMLTEVEYKKLNSKAKQILAEKYFLSKAEAKLGNDAERIAQYLIKKAVR